MRVSEGQGQGQGEGYESGKGLGLGITVTTDLVSRGLVQRRHNIESVELAQVRESCSSGRAVSGGAVRCEPWAASGGQSVSGVRRAVGGERCAGGGGRSGLNLPYICSP